MKKLLADIVACDICRDLLPHPPRPVVRMQRSSKILIIGQAPGTKVHASGIPWDDKSGANLRNWLGVDAEIFYNTKNFAIIPMGFCYPGKGPSGDLPPRPECARRWHPVIFPELRKVKLTLLIGIYAQNYYLGSKAGNTLTETVKNFRDYLPQYFPLPHPSPRNGIWLRKNTWFKEEVLPELRARINEILSEERG